MGHAAAALNDSNGEPSILYVFGGTAVDLENAWHTTNAYDLASDTWTEVGGGPLLMYTNGAAKLGNKLYLSGGFVPDYGAWRDKRMIVATLYAFDGAFKRKADLPKPTADGVSGVIDGKLYVLAGTCLEGGELASCRRLYRYDPVTDSWSTRPWAPHFHGGGAGAVIDNKFYVTGGSAELDVYDPATNRWTTRAPMPERRAGAAGAALGGKFYVIGGSGPSGSRVVFFYDPATDTWKLRAPLLTGRDGLAAARVRLDGRSYILAVGGFEDGGGGGEANEMYTP